MRRRSRIVEEEEDEEEEEDGRESLNFISTIDPYWPKLGASLLAQAWGLPIAGRVWTAKIKFKLLFHWGAPPPRPPVIVGLEASVIDWEGHLPQQNKK